MQNDTDVDSRNDLDVSKIMSEIQDRAQLREDIVPGVQNPVYDAKLLELKRMLLETRGVLDRVHAHVVVKPGLLGKLQALVKKVIHKLILRHLSVQADVNDALLLTCNRLLQHIDWQARSLSSLLEPRLMKRLERRLADIPGPVGRVGHFQYENPDFDYFGFEQKYRGSFESIKEHFKIYLIHYPPHVEGRILDLGCGRGEFVELLSEHGKTAIGYDLNEKNVATAKAKGLNVQKLDIFEALEKQPDNSLAGIFLGQVVEHLSSTDLCRLVKLSYQKLKVEGTFIAETPNPQSLIVFAESFYMDLTHLKPVHPLTFEFILKSEGFNFLGFNFTSAADELKVPPLKIEGKGIEEFNGRMENLNRLVFGARDYAVVARK